MRTKATAVQAMLTPVALMLACGCLMAASGCGAAVSPAELKEARAVFQNAAAGPAGEVAPHELASARDALVKAEAAWEEDAADWRVRDLGYAAQREAEIATAEASITMSEENRAQAQRRLDSAFAQMRQRRRERMEALPHQVEAKVEAARHEAAALVQAVRQMNREKFTVEKWAKLTVEEKLAAERAARIAAEAEVDAQAALARLSDIARLHEEEQGTVATISSDVLFAFNEATLLPDALTKLMPLVDALKDTGREAVIEGHTDWIGTEDYNRRLSFRRAAAVRDFLVQHGIPAARLQVLGIGIANPVGDNHTEEGRALNRRVDIIILKPAASGMKP
jgi:outer membrane protein OmpA-like peptidoglycan-associated protein